VNARTIQSEEAQMVTAKRYIVESYSIKDLLSISGAKFHYISTIKFHTQFEKNNFFKIFCVYVY